MADKSSVTSLLRDVRDGSDDAYEKLFPLVYEELKQIAYSKLMREQDDHTLSRTDLVHEVYLRMVDQTAIEATDRNHFLAIGARCMRRVLIDHARKKKAAKRGGSNKDLTYIDGLMKSQQQAEELVNIDQKLDELAELNERLSKVVELRFFGRMTIAQAADALGLSKSTVKRDWAKARGWLYKELKNSRN